jgi:hypothetical protein
MTPTEYDACLANAIASALAHQEAAALQSQEEARKEQIKLLYAALKAGTATNRQTQSVVAWLLREQARDLAP